MRAPLPQRASIYPERIGNVVAPFALGFPVQNLVAHVAPSRAGILTRHRRAPKAGLHPLGGRAPSRPTSLIPTQVRAEVDRSPAAPTERRFQRKSGSAAQTRPASARGPRAAARTRASPPAPQAATTTITHLHLQACPSQLTADQPGCKARQKIIARRSTLGIDRRLRWCHVWAVPSGTDARLG